MEISTFGIFTLLIISAVAEKTKVLDNTIYVNESLVYTVKNNIVDLHISTINTDIVFIVERKQTDGSFNGLYSLSGSDQSDGGEKYTYTKVLDNGQCTTSDNQTIFFGASDGIHILDLKTKKLEKYGTITADIKAIQKHSNKDIIYVIANNKLKKITERGTKMEEVQSVSGVQEIVLDKDDNLYLFEELNSNADVFEEKYSKPKVLVGDKIIDVKGLPDKYNQIKLARGVIASEGALLILNKRIYRIYSNGSSVATEYVFEDVPTAFFFDLGLVLLFGHKQNLYYFIFSDLFHGIISGMGKFFSDLLSFN